MSHWRKHTTDVLNDIKMSTFELAVADMGISMDRTITAIQNPWGKETVNAGLKKDGNAIPLGFNFVVKDGKTAVQLSGDFYSTGLNERSFIDLLAQHYQKHNTIETIAEQGWTFESCEFNEETKNYDIFAYQYA